MKIHFGAASPLLKYSGVLTSTSTSLIEMISVSLLWLSGVGNQQNNRHSNG